MTAASSKYPKGIIQFKGRFGTYLVTAEKLHAYREHLKTDEGKAWETSCVEAEQDYQSLLTENFRTGE